MIQSASSASAYRSYRNLPSLAGVSSMERATQPGLSVEQCVTRLKRYHYAFKRLHGIFIARICAEPVMELKNGFSHHAYLCSEHVMALRTRVAEMREPPLHLDVVPDPNLEILFDEIRSSPTTEELIVGVYDVAMPRLREAIQRHLEVTNPLIDAPSVRLCRFALMELDDMIDFGRKCVESLVSRERREAMGSWLALLSDCLSAASGLDGTAQPSGQTITRQYSAQPFVYDPIPRRDERFQDLWNQGVNAEAFIYEESIPPLPKVPMLYFKRLREIDVPEMMSRIIHQTTNQDWKYFRDMTRQLWDEARHAMMGEVGFVSLGIDWTQARITHNWSYRLNTECSPLEAHGVLYFIEQGLMGKTGKRFEWEVGLAAGDPLIANIQDYDWADEVLHARIGRLWYIPQFPSREQAIDYGDKAWSKILSNWQTVRDQGLTEHENWWPAIYVQACRTWKQAPDPQVLSFNTTYEGKRADLQSVSG